MSKFAPRDISPILQMFRNFLLGRKHGTALRFSPEVASRSPPPPCLPDGPCHGIHKNYYFTRDVRREVAPPKLIASKQQPLGPGGAAEHEATEKIAGKVLPTPGNMYRWD